MSGGGEGGEGEGEGEMDRLALVGVCGGCLE